MAEITAALVKDLREKTGVGMMDCKKALAENDGNLEAAIDWLRAKGISKAAKKAERAAAEGLVAVEVAGAKGAVVELNSETDFVARNADFQKAAHEFAQIALKQADHASLLAAKASSGGTVQEHVTNLIATIGENITLRRSATLAVGNGVVVPYVHGKTGDTGNLGRIGVLVAVESTGDKAALEKIGKNVAMHIAAANPAALSEADIPADRVEREKAVILEQIKEDPKAQGKPQQVLDKMLEGRMRKFYEESVLGKQAFVMNPDQTVDAAIAEAAKAAGAPVKVAGFIRFAVGEGVEKKQDDFAAEVASMTGKS
ncbi:translation elongation factor Ts [Terricaulis sp.]|uniref:translation elongation factor Ts n=1 Tax=Terricaulis sp. TaxID=2768686 RepID=UPI0037845576